MTHEIALHTGPYRSSSGSLREQDRGAQLPRVRRVSVGDILQCDYQAALPEIEIRTHAAGDAPAEAPISARCVVHELVTTRGSWWSGEYPDETDGCPLCHSDGAPAS